MLIAAILIAIMYLGLVFCIAEMSPALPHTGGAYSFARTAMGPWGGFITGLCENVEYVLTPAVVVFFIGSYLGSIFETPAAFQPVYWIVCYVDFRRPERRRRRAVLQGDADRHAAGARLSGRLLDQRHSGDGLQSLGAEYRRRAGRDAIELPDGNGPFLPFGICGALAAMPFAVWLFLAIEQLPLAAEESVDPKSDMPKGIILAC